MHIPALNAPRTWGKKKNKKKLNDGEVEVVVSNS